MTDTRDTACWPIDRRCPLCGSTLIRNSRYEWCTFVGDQRPGGQKACDYGIASLEPARPAVEPTP